MKVMITGSRDWADKKTVKSILKLFRISEVLEGEAPGADTLAREAAEELGLLIRKFPADWDKYGNPAGPIRNRQMIREKPELVLAFHDNLKKSKGTLDACRAAFQEKILTLHIWHDPNSQDTDSIRMKTLQRDDLYET